MKRRRAVIVFIVGTIILVLLGGALPSMVEEILPETSPGDSQLVSDEQTNPASKQGTAIEALESLPVKDRAPKTGYAREQFGNGWGKTNGCSTRDIILYRDLTNPTLDGACKVVSGILQDPYTGTEIQFSHVNSAAVQIDHVVALSDAWQTGAQQLTIEQRKQLANDPLELIAVDGPANQQKSDGNAATWLPKNKAFRCEYVARQIAVKSKYSLWVVEAEKAAMARVLGGCRDQALPE